jgi:hypothetical protein
MSAGWTAVRADGGPAEIERPAVLARITLLSHHSALVTSEEPTESATASGNIAS